MKKTSEKEIRNQYIYETRAGKIVITDNGKEGSEAAITETGFVTETQVRSISGHQEACGVRMKETPVIQEAKAQLYEYLEGKRTRFQLPYELKGTPFQIRVWKALEEIPFGETRTYGQIAERVGSPKACRAVGQANHNNPIGIFIPCHRVIGSNGKLTGYAGGMDKKEWLLKLERQKTY